MKLARISQIILSRILGFQTLRKVLDWPHIAAGGVWEQWWNRDSLHGDRDSGNPFVLVKRSNTDSK